MLCEIWKGFKETAVSVTNEAKYLQIQPLTAIE